MRKKISKRKLIIEQEPRKYGQVLLTEKQYNTLIKNYGEDLTVFAIQLLNEKISANRFNKQLVNSTNHYQHFRKDGKIINYALEIMNNVGASGTVFY